MSLHPDFPTSPYDPLVPGQRWFPADEALRETAYEKLLPPLVARVRDEVFRWRSHGYTGASRTSVALLRWWFDTDHLMENADGSYSAFRYYFAQREAVETVVWLYEVKRARDKFDLLRFDASGAVSPGMFPEDWPRYVLKIATGAGKTKVLSLLIAWSFFHRLYELDSTLSRNFLVIAPNIIVLERLRADFDGLRIFFNDPILPDNGHDGRNWRDDFQLTLHIQGLELLRKQSNEIDSWQSPFKAIVSVMMLKEGWDVRSVTTIVGLRAYVAQSNILPEQTLGRGLRRMYFGTDTRERIAPSRSRRADSSRESRVAGLSSSDQSTSPSGASSSRR